jgi:hypothetical protein
MMKIVHRFRMKRHSRMFTDGTEISYKSREMFVATSINVEQAIISRKPICEENLERMIARDDFSCPHEKYCIVC